NVPCLVYDLSKSWSRSRRSAANEGPIAPNYCPSSKPWPCASGDMCLSIENLCDGIYHCQDASDEQHLMCNAKNRPSEERVRKMLLAGSRWIAKYFPVDADESSIAKLIV
ncbi:hypothetical protein Ciccas_012958, partial [Cichlidogyrus casuarinus]